MSKVIRLRPETYNRLLKLAAEWDCSIQDVIERLLDWYLARTPAEMEEGSLLLDWPNCPTPDCENKVCQWAGTGLCHPCSVRKIGLGEMAQRYEATREPGTRYWTGKPYGGTPA